MNRWTGLVAWLAALVAPAAPAWAFDNEQTFAKGSYVLSLEGGYGEQFNLEGHRTQSDIKFFNLGIRASVLPSTPSAREVRSTERSSSASGPFISTTQTRSPRSGPASPRWRATTSWRSGASCRYAELAGAAGGTDLRVREIASDFSFLLWGGRGHVVFVSDSTAIYAGYRYEHNSNAKHLAAGTVAGSRTWACRVSYYFP